MSWFDTLKNVFKDKNKKEEKQIENISIEQLMQRLDEKRKDSLEKDNSLKKEIIAKIYQLEIDINKSMESLKKIDLDRRKEYGKIKLIVKENLSLYINYLLKLISDLKNINAKDTKQYIEIIFTILNYFDRSSHKPFEKATILIGEELQATKNLIKDFFIDVKKIVNDNNELFEKIEKINDLTILINEIKQNNAYLKILDVQCDKFNKELDKKIGEQYIYKDKIEEIKSSYKYKDDLQEKEDYFKKLKIFEEEIQSVRKRIDLKLLAKHFHYDSKKNKIIQEYSTNFKYAFKNDKNLEILNMIKIAQNIEMNDLKEIQAKIISLNENIITDSEREISSIEDKIKSIESEISSIKSNIADEIKKKDKILLKKEKIILEIKKQTEFLFTNSNIILMD